MRSCHMAMHTNKTHGTRAVLGVPYIYICIWKHFAYTVVLLSYEKSENLAIFVN